MLKQISILILFVSMALTSCQTFEMADVAPETKGSPMGSVKLGKEGKDFFLIPGKPITPDQMAGRVPVPPSNIVVFKTRERQPHYQALRVAGTPIRGIRRFYTLMVDKVASFAFNWLKPHKPVTQPAVTPTPAPIAFPAGITPGTREPFATPRSLGGPIGPQSAHLFHTPQINQYGG